jgi:predicted permease
MKFGRTLRSRVWRGRVEDEVDSELAFHVEMRARELESRGLSPSEARDAAIRRFGDIHRVNATCRSIGRGRDRDMRRREYLTEFTQDLTFASRQLLHNPGFTIVALQIYARLKPGASGEQALAELQRNAESLRGRFPREDSRLGFAVVTVMEELVGDYRRRLFILLGAVGLVLLIACGNIANLLLARGAARSGELAIRAALGAGRGRIVRQLLTESLLLSFIAGAAGLALASWGVQALAAAAPPGIPRLEQARIDPVVLGFTAFIALFSAIVFGLAPAMRAARTDVQSVLKEGGRATGSGTMRDHLRTAVIIGELALALVVLVGAGLLIRSGIALQQVRPGFDPAGVLAGRLSLPAADYSDPARVLQTFEQVVDAARAVPDVRSAALTSQVPMGPGGNGNGLIPEGRAMDIKNAVDQINFQLPNSNYQVFARELRSFGSWELGTGS